MMKSILLLTQVRAALFHNASLNQLNRLDKKGKSLLKILGDDIILQFGDGHPDVLGSGECGGMGL